MFDFFKKKKNEEVTDCIDALRTDDDVCTEVWPH